MADKDENRQQGVTAEGGERRAALRGDDAPPAKTPGRSGTLPMRKASTLPDVAAYRSSAKDSDSKAQTAGTNESTPTEAQPDTTALSIRPSEEDVSRRASQRDDAVAAKPVLPRVLQVLVAVFFPVILLAAAVRAVATPLFLWVEYHRPGFPADSYGFSTEDRMTYGSYAMDYILNWAPPRYLGGLVGVNGDQLFLDSEVGHMADVKLVLSTGFVVATVLALFCIASCIFLARRYPGGIRRSLFAGAAATLVLVVGFAIAAALAWEVFFTQVHALFFADGTWTFRLDDTLIRLFPAQFWIDSAATVGALVLIVAVATVILTWPTKARREKSEATYASRRAQSQV
ncbi:integral membrane protein (TIGR01906 family) [Arthrobacter pigmenti]|uniref:Integral membrane protein (TIGR01906 family) n=1 Tax=Arthrobacter pigmenti TaxID=271432 RepID=A0A846RKW1_9MICC|nr:integral membrane protein (TIGR01906 family) [Arthrobacter pigmenti]